MGCDTIKDFSAFIVTKEGDFSVFIVTKERDFSAFIIIKEYTVSFIMNIMKSISEVFLT